MRTCRGETDCPRRFRSRTAPGSIRTFSDRLDFRWLQDLLWWDTGGPPESIEVASRKDIHPVMDCSGFHGYRAWKKWDPVMREQTRLDDGQAIEWCTKE